LGLNNNGNGAPVIDFNQMEGMIPFNTPASNKNNRVNEIQM
jgi:hypothetical protein